MSFSSNVKEELAKHISQAKHCQIAELAALTVMCGDIITGESGNNAVKINTENQSVLRKYFTLLEKTFNMNSENENIIEGKDANKLLMVLKLLIKDKLNIPDELVNTLLIQQSCCRRAFIRGAFLASGSISDPNKFYHFEIVCDSLNKAKQLRDIINSFEVDSKIIQRKKYYVVYIKEGTHIVDILNIMEAHVSLMKLENIRILKEMRNSVNRQVNCETANLNKTVGAAVKQIRDIEYVRDTIGFESLNQGLRDIAFARLENPDMNLKDLGALLSPPVGKSGVNHRLRKLSELAEDISGTREEQHYDNQKH